MSSSGLVTRSLIFIYLLGIKYSLPSDFSEGAILVLLQNISFSLFSRSVTKRTSVAIKVVLGIEFCELIYLVEILFIFNVLKLGLR